MTIEFAAFALTGAVAANPRGVRRRERPIAPRMQTEDRGWTEPNGRPVVCSVARGWAGPTTRQPPSDCHRIRAAFVYFQRFRA
jgi:hypothetical protein